MRLPLSSVVVACAGVFAGLAMVAQAPAPDTVRYAGTIGQQQVLLQLKVADDTLRDGHYGYRNQPGQIHIVDSRRFGTTLVLQDEDGNILHLHFENAAGEKAGTFQAAAMLEGTLDRGELDLPVKLTRQER